MALVLHNCSWLPLSGLTASSHLRSLYTCQLMCASRPWQAVITVQSVSQLWWMVTFNFYFAFNFEYDLYFCPNHPTEGMNVVKTDWMVTPVHPDIWRVFNHWLILVILSFLCGQFDLLQQVCVTPTLVCEFPSLYYFSVLLLLFYFIVNWISLSVMCIFQCLLMVLKSSITCHQ